LRPEDAPEVLGSYVLLELLGHGGMATVYRAEQRGVAGFSRPVALKRLLPQVAEDPDMVKAFVHEAHLASQLHHANIAQTYDLGKVGDEYFIAMEFVPGPTLTQVMRQCAQAAGAPPIPIVLAIIGEVCDALDYAHLRTDDLGKPLGIIHRDVSPSNVIVSNAGIVKLIDFGIAKAADSGIRTKTGMIKGKFGYVAPEYTRGLLDARADLFGVGVIAHELLTNRPLFQAKSDFDTITRLREMPIQPPSRWNPQVTRDLDDIVMTALQRDSRLRWQNASAMRIAITNASRPFDLVGSQQLREWLEWTFSQQPRGEDSALSDVINALGEPSSVSIELSLAELDELDRIGDPLVAPSEREPGLSSPPAPSTRVSASRAAAPREPLAAEDSGELLVPSRPRRRRWPWLLALLLLAGGAGAAYYYFVYLDNALPF
jgi:serine/threonine protein kinase